MGWMQRVKDAVSRRLTKTIYAGNMTGRTPIYSTFGQDIYASDVVNQAMACVTNEIKKLTPMHVIQEGMDIFPAPAGDSRQRVLNRPNHYQTTFDFLGVVMYEYFSKCNAWVVPTYKLDIAGRKTYTGLYPIKPQRVTFLEDATGELFVEFRFANEPEPWMLPYSEVIHLRRDYGADEYMGGAAGGLPDDTALLSILEINHQMLQGITKAMKTSQAINGVVKWGTVMDRERMKTAMTEFEQKLLNNQSGILGMDISSEYVPINRNIKIVDAATLEFIDKKILRGFGSSLPVLNGTATKEEHEAFHQRACEHIVIQLGQEFTRVLCTETEDFSSGHKIQFFSKELQFYSIDQKINMINLLAPTGAMYENEKRVALGLWPLEELKGKRYISLNWIDSSQAADYQAAKAGQQKPTNNGGGNDE